MKKNKNPKEIKMDENGTPVEAEKKGVNWKSIGKKVLCGIGLFAAGFVSFIAVGAAMACASGGSSEDISEGDGGDSDSSGAAEDSGSYGGAEE